MNFLKRSRELGIKGITQRIWARFSGWLILTSQSFWWDFKARKMMGNSSFLSHTTGDWQTVDDLLSHLAKRDASSFILPHESPEETLEILKKHYPEYLSDLLSSASVICENKRILHGRTFDYPASVDWLCDPVTGWQWPLLYRERMSAYTGASRPADLIIFWALNRHHHFIKLGIAYWLTGDEQYVDTFIEQIRSWIKANPLKHGINWYYPLESSMRLITWTTAFQFFRSSPKFQQEVGEDFIKSLWQQADFVSNNLQQILVADDIPNNHMVAELTGLILIGTVFPEFTAATEWREKGLHLLVEQIKVQTHLDGVNKEQTTGYHRFVTEFLLLVLAHNHRGVLESNSVLGQILEKMLDYMLFSLLPNGKTPMWGDADYARVLGLGFDKDFWDFRPLLSTGAVLFERPDWKFAAGRFGEESFWLLGIEGMKKWEQMDAQIPQERSRAFLNAGQYIIRDSWTKDTDVAFFRCGEFGLGGEGYCAHAHSDLLSFILWVGGQPLFVDSGTYIYHGPMRDYFRLTSAHNTVMIDGRDQAIPKPNFKWREIPEAKNIGWSGNSVIGVLNYQEVEFTRRLSHPRPGIWMLDDKFLGEGDHKLDWFFNFAPGFDFVWQKADGILKVNRDGAPFVNIYLPNDGISAKLDDAWYSNQYATKKSTRKLHAEWQGALENGKVFSWKFELIDKAFVASSKEE